MTRVYNTISLQLSPNNSYTALEVVEISPNTSSRFTVKHIIPGSHVSTVLSIIICSTEARKPVPLAMMIEKKGIHSRTNITNLLFIWSAKFLIALNLMENLPVTSMKPAF